MLYLALFIAFFFGLFILNLLLKDNEGRPAQTSQSIIGFIMFLIGFIFYVNGQYSGIESSISFIVSLILFVIYSNHKSHHYIGNSVKYKGWSPYNVLEPILDIC